MTFALFLPPQAKDGPVPVLWYLSGLTCTHQNVMDKGEYRQLASELGIAVICPDTSPRGDSIADSPIIGNSARAGFYVDAMQAPFAQNYRMYSYITQELSALVARQFPLDMERQAITGTHGRAWRTDDRTEEPRSFQIRRFRSHRAAFDGGMVEAGARKISGTGRTGMARL